MITELRLRNNVGLLTKGTKSVELNLAQLMNIFMGRNGFGKTSILKECHPLPPENSDYAKGGYKYVKWVISQQEFYILESNTGSSSTHSFKKNGVEELNTGGTLTVQRELCEQYFGITPALVKYMNGIKWNNLFTMMTTATRKQIIMDMYPNDTRYAVNVHNKIKTELRNCIGAIKNQHKRLAEENERRQRLQTTSIPELEAKIEGLDQQIKDAMVLSGMLSGIDNMSGELKEAVQQFVKLTKELVLGSVTSISSPQELEEQLTQYQRIIGNLNDDIRFQRSKIADLMETLSGVNYVTESPEILEERLNSVKQIQLQDQTEFDEMARVVHNEFGEIDDDTLEVLVRASNGLIDSLLGITLASNKSVTLLGYQVWLEELDTLGSRGRNLKAAVEELTHALKHFDNAEDLTCPQCEHNFKPGFDLKDIDFKRKELERLNIQLNQVREQHRKLKQKLELDEEFYQTLSNTVALAKSMDNRERTLLNILKDRNVGYVNQDSLIHALRCVSVYREKMYLIKQHNVEIDSLTIRLNLLRRNDVEELSRQVTEYETLLASNERSLRRFNDKVEDVEYKLETIKAREVKLDFLGVMQDELMELFRTQGKWVLKQATQSAVNEWVPAKDQHMQMLIRARSTESVIQSIEEDIANLERRKVKLQLLQDTICPNKGMIGKLMEDFIKAVVGNMNAIIREVFTTPLYVLPCVNGKGDLDYNFPVINSVDGKPSKDVSDCSGGEQDIINLAFRMILMRYRMKNRFPLVLDEVGTKLDTYHQQRLFDYIRNISTSGDINQILMVSHFFAHTSMFPDANVVALNSEGITVPENANQNAKFK